MNFFKKKRKVRRFNTVDFSLNSGERQTGKTLCEIRFDHRARYNLAIDWIRRNYNNHERLVCTDIFCGNGYGCHMITDILDCSVIGIDASSEAITFANQYFSNKKTFFIYKKFPFELPPNISDFITCFESLEHVKDSHSLIEELYENLKEGGLIFLSTPNEKYFTFQKDQTPFHFKHYYFEELIELINEITDFKLINWYGQNLYSISADGKRSILPDEKMKLIEKMDGQILIFIFQKAGGTYNANAGYK